MKTYGSTEVQKLAKISKMQAIHWTQVGAVIPLEDAKGRGSRRVYSWQNLIEMMICRELNRLTIETHVMVLVLHMLRYHFSPRMEVYNTDLPLPLPPIGPDYKATGSFWDRLDKVFEANLVYLYIHRSEKPEFTWVAGVLGRKGVAGLLKTKGSVLVINIRELINEIEGG